MKCFLRCEGFKMAVMMAFAMVSMSTSAQFLRSSYFMESSEYRQQLNPALAPDNGYIHAPIIGGTSASLKSNSLGMYDLIDMMKNVDDDDYFTTDAFFGKLKDENIATMTMASDILSAGMWHGSEFMSFNVTLRADGNLNVARGLFSFLRDMKGMNENDYTNYMRNIGNHEFNATIYTELGFGYTRLINDRWSIGGRVKALLGMGNMNLKVNKATVQTNLEGVDPHIDWTLAGPDELMNARGTAAIDVDAELQTSAHGLDLITKDHDYIDEIKFHTGNMGVAGFGAALDLGFAVNVTKELSLSAALTDLGFIRWSKDNTQVAHAKSNDLSFDSENPGDIMRFSEVVGAGDVLNLDMIRLTKEPVPEKARNTSLASTMAIGGEYRLMDEKLKLGALYTSRFAKVEPDNELTLSVGYRPKKMLDFVVSYSPIMCGGQSFGLAMKLGPLFVGTDYFYMGNKTKCCNAMVGLSIPLVRSHRPILQQPED